MKRVCLAEEEVEQRALVNKVMNLPRVMYACVHTYLYVPQQISKSAPQHNNCEAFAQFSYFQLEDRIGYRSASCTLLCNFVSSRTCLAQAYIQQMTFSTSAWWTSRYSMH